MSGEVEYWRSLYERDQQRAATQRAAQKKRYHDRRLAKLEKSLCAQPGCEQTIAPGRTRCDDHLAAMADIQRRIHVRLPDRAVPRCSVCVAMGASGEGHTARNHDRAMRMAERGRDR